MKDILSPSELEHLSQVIAEAEKKTSGELRLIIVRQSSRLGHALPLLWLSLVALGLIVLWEERHLLPPVAAAWAVPALLIISALVSWPLSRWSTLRRWLTPVADLRGSVWARAELEFHREGLGGTKGSTGILLFLSLLEHQAVVLADKGIASRLDPSTWDGVVRMILEGPKTGKWAKASEL
ncbi:MAG: hypothetical protein HC902_03220, partial [Calothrix sp. SM1_5_4]|nr:hypothetical protein [Calothrix sp. SM1_5_4]